MRASELKPPYKRIIEMIDNGRDIKEVIKYLSNIYDKFSSKVDVICKIIKDYSAINKAIDDECSSLEKRKKENELIERSFTNFLIKYMDSNDCAHIQTQQNEVFRRVAPSSVDVLTPDSVPDQYMRSTGKEVDKGKILKEYRANGTIPNGIDIVNKDYLIIR